MRTRSIFELNGAQVARIIASADFHPQRVSKRLLSVHVAPSFASVLNLDLTSMRDFRLSCCRELQTHIRGAAAGGREQRAG